MQEIKENQLTEMYNLAIYYYSLDPTVTLAVSSSGGSLTSINDTRLQAGAMLTAASSFPNEAQTAEPSTVTVAYQRLTQSTSANTPTSDTGVTFPVYWNGTQVQAMSQTDFLDTFVYPAINLMVTGDLTASQGGTYHISTSTSVLGSTLVSSIPVFADTRADTAAYTASGLGSEYDGVSGEVLDQPTTVTSYYLHQLLGTPAIPSVIPTYIDSNNNLKQYSVAEIGNLMGDYVRHQAVSSSTGFKISYNIDGSGTTRGTAMVNTILTGGSGNYQTKVAGANDYRAQEFPDGTVSTANTYNFKILKSS